jgi:rubrerythrin
MSTKENLEEAFAGESKANRKYLAFAKKAEDEGYDQVAYLFRAIAEAETIHAHNHLDAMGAVGSTEENLQEAIDGEDYEFQDMYPPFYEEAKEEGESQAASGFRYAMEAEQIHSALYSEALKVVTSGEDLPEQDVYLCKRCGHTALSGHPDICPICGARSEYYFKVEK